MKHLFKRSIALLITLAMLLSVLPVSFAAEDTTDEFVVLTTTDMHGRVWDKNVLNDTNSNNSMLNVATAVKEIRESYDNVILLDNGDTYQGTPVSSYQLSLQKQGLTELPNPVALCLKEIDYDAATIGNHEFNYAWDLMEEVRAYLADETKGNKVESLCANLYWEATGENVFTPYIFREFTLAGEAYKVAIIGFENTDCPRWDIPDNYPGIVFTHPENTTGAMAWEAQKYVAEVKEQGADLVIVAYHSGLGDGDAPEDIEFGVNSENQILSMIKNNTGIDLVIAGHDHSSSYSGNTYADKDGKEVMVVNGAGNNLTKTVFAVDESGKLYIKSNEAVSLSTKAADAGLKEKMVPYVGLASEYVNQECGVILEGDWSKSTKFYMEQTDTMDLIGRAQMAMGSKYLAEKYDTETEVAELFEKTGLDHLEVDMSSTSVVVSGNYTVQPGTMNMKKIYQLYKYDNTLYLIPLTGQQIKDVLEFNASERLSVNTGSGEAVFGTIGDDFTNPIFYGLDFVYDMAQEPGSRAVISGFANGNPFELDKTYIFAVNNYHLGNGPFAQYSTDDAIWSQTDDLGGGVVQDLIAEWLTAETAANGGVAPAPSNWEITYTGEIVAGKAEGEYIGDLVDPNTLENGDMVLIYYPAANTFVSNVASGNRLAPNADASVGVSDEGVKQAGTSTAANIFSVVKNEDGSVSFMDADGKFMTSGDTGNSLTMTDAASACSNWTFEATEGGYYVHNEGANYKGNYNQYLEFYSGFTTYGLGSGGAIYTFAFYKLPVEEIPTGEELVILYTNDVHTYIDNEGLRYSNVAALKQELEAEGKRVLLVDAGDHIQGTAFGSMDKGETIIKLMNAANYDYATLGNHEFDYGMARMLELVDMADFQYLSTNFHHLENGVKDGDVLYTGAFIPVGDKTVGIIGITTPESFTKSTPAYFMDENGNYIYGIDGGADGQELYKSVQETIDSFKEADCDYIVALGHLGDDPASQPWTSEEVIANVSGLDAFIDGHSHSTVAGKEVLDKDGNPVLLTQTGEYLNAVGKMVISAEGITTELITEYDKADEKVKAIEDEWIAKVDDLLGEVIAKNEVDFRIKDETGRLIRKQETNLGDFCADALYYLFDVTEGLGADIAIMNGGGIRADMPAGDVSYLTTKTVHTFGNVACLIEVTGQQILDALEWGAKNVGTGENGGFLQVAGATYEIHGHIPATLQMDDKGVWTGGPTGEYRVKNVKIGGEPLDLTKTYKLAGYNYTLRDLGDGFAMFEGATNVKDYVMEDYMVLANYAKAFPEATIKADNSPLGADYSNIYGEGRITIIIKTHEVTFLDHDGSVIETLTVMEGHPAVPSSNPLRAGYRFMGWDADISAITEDMTVTATYREIPKTQTAEDFEVVGEWVWGETVAELGADTIVERCAKNGITDIYMLVKGTGGKLGYLKTEFTDILTRENRDVLQEMIDAAHAAGIRVHAWLCSMEDEAFKTSNPEAGLWHYKRARDNNIMTPYNEEYKAFMVKVAEEIVSGYDVDGIHLDYIRYNHLCNGWSEEDFANLEAMGANIENVKYLINKTFYADLLPEGEEVDADYIFNAYRNGDADALKIGEYRRNNVVGLATAIRDAAKAIDPDILFTGALMPEGGINYGSADVAFGDLHYGQNYTDAAELYDYIVPMAYSASYGEDPSWMADIAKYSVEVGNKVVMGTQSFYPLTSAQLMADINAVRDLLPLEGVLGIAHFRHSQFSYAKFTYDYAAGNMEVDMINTYASGGFRWVIIEVPEGVTITAAEFVNGFVADAPIEIAEDGRSVKFGYADDAAEEVLPTLGEGALKLTTTGRPMKNNELPLARIWINSNESRAYNVYHDETPAFENPFTDVEEGVWYYDYIMEAASKGLVNGVKADLFKPNANLTRAQFATILYRYLGSPSVEGKENPFQDLEADWYKDAVIYMSSIGVVKGKTETKFAPNDNITREQMVTMLFRLEGITVTEGYEVLDNFVDKDAVSTYAVQAMVWAINTGLINGLSGNKLAPQGLATRAQAAKVISLYAAQD